MEKHDHESSHSNSNITIEEVGEDDVVDLGTTPRTKKEQVDQHQHVGSTGETLAQRSQRSRNRNAVNFSSGHKDKRKAVNPGQRWLRWPRLSRPWFVGRSAFVMPFRSGHAHSIPRHPLFVECRHLRGNLPKIPHKSIAEKKSCCFRLILKARSRTSVGIAWWTRLSLKAAR